jgi:hypothetical protein
MCDIHPTTTTTTTAAPTTAAPTTAAPTTAAPTSAAPTTAAPTSEAPETTTKEHNDNECTEAMEVFPYPGDCHKYYICIPTETDGIFDITVSIIIFFIRTDKDRLKLF